MDYHQNARLTIHSREQLASKVIVEKCTLKPAPACFRVSAKTAARWVRQLHEEGLSGLRDRSSRPQRLRHPTSAELVSQVEQLRRQRWTGLRIAQQTGLSRATVSRILRRLRLSRMRDLEPRLPVRRYEHERPGDLLHLDIKKLGRIARPSHPSPATATTRSPASAGNICSWPSTITPASPSPPSIRMKRPIRRSFFCRQH